MARIEYLPAGVKEVRLDLAILRADRNIVKQELAMNKAICSLHPHKIIVETMKLHSPRLGYNLSRFFGIKAFRARNSQGSK
jgi:deoxyribose-phosphate aldolase